MNSIQLRYQIALFGNFDEITPTVENIKFFIENFSDKGFIPSQFNELNLGVPNIPPTNASRLSLTSNDSSWNIMFGKERLDFILTNTNIGIYQMPTKDGFLSTFNEIYSKISKNFPKKLKRIGFVCQYLIRDIELPSLSKKINISPSYFNNNSLIEFSNRYASRSNIKVPQDEIVNTSGELSWIKTLMAIDGKNSLFDGLMLNIDINSLAENQDYRFDDVKLQLFLTEVSKIETKVFEDYSKMLNA